MNKITIEHWFLRKIKFPLVLGTAAVAVIQIVLLLYFANAQEKSRQESTARFNEELSLAISQKNRTLVESTLAHAKANLNAKAIALCEGKSGVVEIPAGKNVCENDTENFLQKRIFITGHSSYVVTFAVSFSKEYGLQFGILVASLLLIALVSILFSRASSSLRRNIVSPLQLDIANETALSQSLNAMQIAEVAHIYSEHLAKVNVIRNLAIENERMARLAAAAQVTQMLAHDVRRPLHLVKATLDLLKKAKSLEQMEKITVTATANITKATVQVEGLIADVMELGGNSEFPKTELFINDLFQDAVQNVSQLYPAASVKVSIDIGTEAKIFANRGKIDRVISNILGNAYQALKMSGKVWLRARDTITENGKFVEITIGNNGPKIDSEDLPKLFESFFTKGKEGGTGLGLAIAQKVVNAHGGKIWCESGVTDNFPGGYVEFKFILPPTHTKD
jgi:signal transduction histidine kinase